MENARKMYDEWEVPINLYKSRNHVEIEWRLGRTGKQFDTNVGKETFEKILRGLQKYKGWEEVREKTFTVFYGPKGSNKRVTYDEVTDEQESIIKKRIVVADYKLDDRSEEHTSEL